MLVLLVLLIVLLIIPVYFFFAPFYFEINSNEALYRFRFHHFGSASFKASNDTILLELRILFWQRQFDLLAAKPRKKVKPLKKEKSRRKVKISLKGMKAVMKSFKISRCHISIDTGDNQLNGKLYPVFYLIGFYSQKNIGINFIGENLIILKIKNSFARMVSAYIKNK